MATAAVIRQRNGFGQAERRRTRSDWMAVERERGISVSSAVMSFEHQGLAFNTLDTPGHQDFSALGFQRGHLPHPDCGRQRGVGARRRRQRYQGGIEEQTRKLFEVCRLRDVPIITLSTSATARAATRANC
jgi:peptide chain release factor 3